ncbi:MAG: copper resistance protein NlpE N-terminal domain-containing protein [Acidobacterium ailaaui]|nr:copper resistance protein NlpE N-terminal domain-containing protein [Pseudacidobacterium ailaaui]
MKFLTRAVLPVAVFVLAPVALEQAAHSRQQGVLARKARTMWVLGTWQGTLPCADCSGIVTTLTLYEKAPKDFQGAIYRMHRHYLDRGSDTDYGHWRLLQGTSQTLDAVIYELDPDLSTRTQYFLRVDENTLQQLDREMKPIASSMNFKLERIAVESPPAARLGEK